MQFNYVAKEYSSVYLRHAFTSLYFPLGLIVCRCNYPLLTELKVWSLEKLSSIRVQVNRMKHAAGNIETLSYTCVKLRNLATCWLEKFV